MTIRQLRAIAQGLGISVAELIKRRQAREMRNQALEAEDATLRVRTKPQLLCDPTLPDAYQIIFKTEYR